MNIKLIIFDFDGTIMDTKKTIVVSKQETLRQMGLDVAEEQACADTIGMSAKIGFQKLCPELSDDMIDLCMKKYREIFDETKKTIPPLLFPVSYTHLDVYKRQVLDPYDICRLTRQLQMPFESLVEKHLALNVVDGVILPNLKMAGENETCTFLNEQQRCRIHGARPVSYTHLF